MSSPQASDDANKPEGGRRLTVLVVVLATLLLLLGGAAVLALSGDEPEGAAGRQGENPSTGPAAGSASEGPGGVAVPTRVVRVAGELHAAAERRLVEEVRALVEEYVDDAYVEGREEFPGFTDRVRRLARRDADVTTGRRLGEGQEVTLRSGRARVSVVSARPRNPVGATAAVRLVLAAGAGSTTRSTVTGRLMLTPSARGWRVFGYDLAVSGLRGRVDAATEDGRTSR